MLLQLSHKSLDVYKLAKALVVKCYEITDLLPPNERYNLSSQIRRAATSILLNIAEGSSKMSSRERRHFFEISRSSLVEIDAALDIAVSLKFITVEKVLDLQDLSIRCFSTLSRLIKSNY